MATTATVALAHDVLAARAGGERVLTALADTFADAPIHTLFFEPQSTFSELDPARVNPSALNKISWLRPRYRHVVPIAPLAFAATRIDADVLICSSSGLSHHVRTSGAKIVYCHTPARWLHDTDVYLTGFRRSQQVLAASIAPAYRRLDRWAMQRADIVIANSSHIASQIAEVYGIEARVITPCSNFELDGPTEPIAGVGGGFILSPARPLGYKRLDVLHAAARALPDRDFVHIGDGPHRDMLAADAPPNLRSFGAVNDAQLRWAYRNASLVALTCAEDFGLVPLEAAAHGVFTVAPAARGLLDHDPSMLVSYEFASVAGLVEAIDAAPAPTLLPDPSRLGRERFSAAMRRLVDEVR